MSKSLHDQAVQHAQKSKQKLNDYLWDNYLDDTDLMAYIARAITDAKIEGLLSGVTMVEDKVQLDAYTRGYLDGRNDAK